MGWDQRRALQRQEPFRIHPETIRKIPNPLLNRSGCLFWLPALSAGISALRQKSAVRESRPNSKFHQIKPSQGAPTAPESSGNTRTSTLWARIQRKLDLGLISFGYSVLTVTVARAVDDITQINRFWAPHSSPTLMTHQNMNGLVSHPAGT